MLSFNNRAFLALEIKFKKHLKSLAVKEGENVTLECKINTEKPVQVEWLHYGQSVYPNNKLVISRDGGKLQLLIKHITVS